MEEFNSNFLDDRVSLFYKTNKEFLIALNNIGVPVKEDAVKKWRQGKSIPKSAYLSGIATLLKCNVVDFYTNADKKREQIAVEEITSDPERYSNSISKAFLSTLPEGTDKLIENFLLLTKEQQEEVQEHIKELAQENMKF